MARGQTLGSVVFNKPQLISLDAFQPIVNYLSNPDRATKFQIEPKGLDEFEEELFSESGDEEQIRRRQLIRQGINPETMVGVLDVSGALVYRSGSMGADCTELTSYEGLKKQAEGMIEQGVNTIVLKVDSHGGMAYGMFSAANYIKKISRKANVKTVTYVDGSAYSAGYGLAVLSDELVVNPQSSVGSVGVVVSLYNDSKALEKAGYTRQFVFAGDNKIPFDNSTGEFTESFLSGLQKSVNKTYKSFVRHVASYRGLNEQAVIDTQADVFDAEEALELGLVDKIMELEDFELEYGLKTPKNTYRGFTTMAATTDSSQNTKEGIMSEVNDKTEAPQVDELLSKAQNTEQKEDTQLMGDNLQESFMQMKQQNAELTTKLKGAEELLGSYESQIEELKNELASKEKEQLMAERKAKLEGALGEDNDNVSKLLSSTESLSAEQFEAVVESLSASQDTKQDQLSEIGGEGQDSNVQLSLAEKIKQRAEALNQRKA